MKAYYIFNDLNLGPDKIRVQGNKKRIPYAGVKLWHLKFSDKSILMLLIGKELKFLKYSQELECLLIERGVVYNRYTTEQLAEQSEFKFDKNFSLRLDERYSQQIKYWSVFISSVGKDFSVYGRHPLNNSMKVAKIYESDKVPSKEVMKSVAIEKPTPNWVVAIIVIVIFFIAAMIYSSTYNS